MTLRRRMGAGIMLAGAAMLVAAIAWIVILVAGLQRGETGLIASLVTLLTSGGWPVAAGVGAMVGGRAVYGHWRTAAPVVNVTGEIARTVGLVVAMLLAAVLVFILVTGFDQGDLAAIAALAAGIAFSFWVAQLGGNLRGRGYLD